jgi:CCR4-NOT transcriptional regulation complex NOT5 subunit
LKKKNWNFHKKYKTWFFKTEELSNEKGVKVSEVSN